MESLKWLLHTTDGTTCNHQSLAHTAITHDNSVIVHTDSKSSLEALQCDMSKDSITLDTSNLTKLQFLKKQNREVDLHWLPGHVGIAGNELADEAAKATSRCNTIGTRISQPKARLCASAIANQITNGIGSS